MTRFLFLLIFSDELSFAVSLQSIRVGGFNVKTPRGNRGFYGNSCFFDCLGAQLSYILFARIAIKLPKILQISNTSLFFEFGKPIFSFFQNKVVNITISELRLVSNERSGNFSFYNNKNYIVHLLLCLVISFMK